ncbi:hypothetical protein CP533_6919 [Ophiocordyceps camponoti-saundersi (nom. inval.)]|nr:hypothetical protein CP533_6919 [Ophiocordyceps camponoti-saundersi (nom. inval.)]
MDKLVKSGRALYAGREFKKALINFTRAMHLCPCNMNRKRKRCSCKDYEAVVNRDGSIYEEAMFNCSCDASKLFSKCQDLLHITALDSRAASFEALEELDRAEADAKWMLELAPSLPQGYLRLGKIARLRKNSWLAWKIYSAGVEANKHAPLESSYHLQKLKDFLKPLQMHFTRKDPMNLPLEIIHEIFFSVNVVDLTKCLRVSKTWKHILTSGQSQRLWRQLVFLEPPPRTLSARAIKALVGRSGNTVRRIVIRDLNKFKLNHEKLIALLWHSRSLEHLDITYAWGAVALFPYQPGSYENLRSLTMDTRHEHHTWSSSQFEDPANFLPISRAPRERTLLPIELVSCAASCLEHLDLFDIPLGWTSGDRIPNFPRLKTIRLQMEHFSRDMSFPIFTLASKTQQLEQLCVNKMLLTYNDSQLSQPGWHDLWLNLKAFVFRMPSITRSIDPFETVMCIMLLHSIQLGNGFRHLDLHIPYENRGGPENHGFFLYSVRELGSMNGALAEVVSRMPYLQQFSNLRSLRLEKLSQDPFTMRSMLQDAIAGGEFREFDIVFPISGLNDPQGESSAQHLRRYDWLRGLRSLRYIGLSRFFFTRYECALEENPLPAFLASFPNLVAVSLHPEFMPSDDAYLLCLRIMSETSVKTLYQTCVSGSVMDSISARGADLGVEVVCGRQPRQWPVPLEE